MGTQEDSRGLTGAYGDSGGLLGTETGLIGTQEDSRGLRGGLWGIRILQKLRGGLWGLRGTVGD